MNSLFQEIEMKANDLSFFGVISIYKSNKELFNKAFGLSDIANKRVNTPATKFGIASGTKLFTALGIGKLINEGAIDFNTPIHEIFQSNLTWIDEKATIHHLLTHTSGIHDYYDEDIITDFDNFFVDIPWYQLETPSDYLPLFSKHPYKFKAGERFSYSNGGYICLGIIIEKISQKLYREFIQKEIFEPTGMHESGFYAFNQLPENTAYGYKLNQMGVWATNIYNLPIRGASDGGAYTTTYDINRLWTSLTTNQLLSKEIAGKFLSSQVYIRESLDYGYGLYLSQIEGKRVFIINGSDCGVGFESRYYPDSELTINIFSNITDGEVEMVKYIFDQFPIDEFEE